MTIFKLTKLYYKNLWSYMFSCSHCSISHMLLPVLIEGWLPHKKLYIFSCNLWCIRSTIHKPSCFILFVSRKVTLHFKKYLPIKCPIVFLPTEQYSIFIPFSCTVKLLFCTLQLWENIEVTESLTLHMASKSIHVFIHNIALIGTSSVTAQWWNNISI